MTRPNECFLDLQVSKWGLPVFDEALLQTDSEVFRANDNRLYLLPRLYSSSVQRLLEDRLSILWLLLRELSTVCLPWYHRCVGSPTLVNAQRLLPFLFLAINVLACPGLPSSTWNLGVAPLLGILSAPFFPVGLAGKLVFAAVNLPPVAWLLSRLTAGAPLYTRPSQSSFVLLQHAVSAVTLFSLELWRAAHGCTVEQRRHDIATQPEATDGFVDSDRSDASGPSPPHGYPDICHWDSARLVSPSVHTRPRRVGWDQVEAAGAASIKCEALNTATSTTRADPSLPYGSPSPSHGAGQQTVPGKQQQKPGSHWAPSSSTSATSTKSARCRLSNQAKGGVREGDEGCPLSSNVPMLADLASSDSAPSLVQFEAAPATLSASSPSTPPRCEQQQAQQRQREQRPAKPVSFASPFASRARLLRTAIKIHGVEPEQVEAGWEARVAAVVSEVGLQLHAAYVRGGCCELVVDTLVWNDAAAEAQPNGGTAAPAAAANTAGLPVSAPIALFAPAPAAAAAPAPAPSNVSVPSRSAAGETAAAAGAMMGARGAVADSAEAEAPKAEPLAFLSASNVGQRTGQRTATCAWALSEYVSEPDPAHQSWFQGLGEVAPLGDGEPWRPGQRPGPELEPSGPQTLSVEQQGRNSSSRGSNSGSSRRSLASRCSLDIGALIRALRLPSEGNIEYGMSYGLHDEDEDGSLDCGSGGGGNASGDGGGSGASAGVLHNVQAAEALASTTDDDDSAYDNSDRLPPRRLRSRRLPAPGPTVDPGGGGGTLDDNDRLGDLVRVDSRPLVFEPYSACAIISVHPRVLLMPLPHAPPAAAGAASCALQGVAGRAAPPPGQPPHSADGGAAPGQLGGVRPVAAAAPRLRVELWTLGGGSDRVFGGASGGGDRPEVVVWAQGVCLPLSVFFTDVRQAEAAGLSVQTGLRHPTSEQQSPPPQRRDQSQTYQPSPSQQQHAQQQQQQQDHHHYQQQQQQQHPGGHMPHHAQRTVADEVAAAPPAAAAAHGFDTASIDLGAFCTADVQLLSLPPLPGLLLVEARQGRQARGTVVPVLIIDDPWVVRELNRLADGWQSSPAELRDVLMDIGCFMHHVHAAIRSSAASPDSRSYSLTALLRYRLMDLGTHLLGWFLEGSGAGAGAVEWADTVRWLQAALRAIAAAPCVVPEAAAAAAEGSAAAGHASDAAGAAAGAPAAAAGADSSAAAVDAVQVAVPVETDAHGAAHPCTVPGDRGRAPSSSSAAAVHAGPGAVATTAAGNSARDGGSGTPPQQLAQGRPPPPPPPPRALEQSPFAEEHAPQRPQPRRHVGRLAFGTVRDGPRQAGVLQCGADMAISASLCFEKSAHQRRPVGECAEPAAVRHPFDGCAKNAAAGGNGRGDVDGDRVNLRDDEDDDEGYQALVEEYGASQIHRLYMLPLTFYAVVLVRAWVDNGAHLYPKTVFAALSAPLQPLQPGAYPQPMLQPLFQTLLPSFRSASFTGAAPVVGAPNPTTGSLTAAAAATATATGIVPAWLPRLAADLAPSLVATFPALVTAVTWPLLPRRAWARLVRLCMLPRLLVHLAAGLIVGALRLAPSKAVSGYHLGPAVMVGDGLLYLGTALVPPTTALVLGVLRVPVYVIMWFAMGADFSLPYAWFRAVLVSFLAVATNAACHAYLRSAHRRRRRRERGAEEQVVAAAAPAPTAFWTRLRGMAAAGRGKEE